MAETYIGKLIDYWGYYFPAAAAAAEGANPQQISDLEQLVGRSLPDDYRQYLERMGGYGISINTDGPGSRAADVIIYYRDLYASGQTVPDGYVIIAPGDRVSSIGLQDQPDRKPAVVLMGDRGEAQIRPLADSLPNLLFQTVFTNGNNAVSPCFGSGQGRASCDWLNQARQAAADLGLAEQRFSEPSLLCCQGETTAISVNQFEASMLSVRVWSRSREEGEHCGDVLAQHLGLRGIPIHPSYTYRP